MLRKLLPHLAIVMSCMYAVFFGIDRVNSAMAFIENDITKWLLLMLCLISIANAVLVIIDDRERERRRRARAKKRARAGGAR